MADAGRLRSDDVGALKSLARHADRHLAPGSRDERYHAQRRMMEAELSPEARSFWFETASDRFRRALATFVPAYRNVRTSRGWTAYRYVKRRACYASRACATGLSAPLEGWTRA